MTNDRTRVVATCPTSDSSVDGGEVLSEEYSTNTTRVGSLCLERVDKSRWHVSLLSLPARYSVDTFACTHGREQRHCFVAETRRPLVKALVKNDVCSFLLHTLRAVGDDRGLGQEISLQIHQILAVIGRHGS